MLMPARWRNQRHQAIEQFHGRQYLDDTARPRQANPERSFAHLGIDFLQRIRFELRFTKIYFFRSSRCENAIDHDGVKV